MGDQPDTMSLPTQNNTNAEETRTYTYAWNGIRTHDPNIRASKNILCLKVHGHRDRLKNGLPGVKKFLYSSSSWMSYIPSSNRVVKIL
jgi:hypothetical protein